MITTGKNLGEIIGDFGHLHRRARTRSTTRTASSRRSSSSWRTRSTGRRRRARRPTTTSPSRPSRIRVNCELNHVDVVLCCDPKAFTHTNPLDGSEQGRLPRLGIERHARDRLAAHPGAVPRSSSRRTTSASSSCPGSRSRASATERPDLQLRMQGNSFLGAFFRVSPVPRGLRHQRGGVPRTVIRKQYEKKFGRFGDAVVESNMTGHGPRASAGSRRSSYGEIDDPDRSVDAHPPLAAGR